ncbi:MAG: 4Fe-4S binding protein [Candidatus Coatesbacteria bacterium]|nr:4Fe-4S binding protein [Candidatus Coatesbacteria bacterium]
MARISNTAHKEVLARRSRTRRILQSSLWIIVVVVIGLGWRYPLLGYAVPIVMLIGVVGGFIRGRYVCGWLCPRGAFFDRVMTHISPKKKIPEWLRKPVFRWIVFCLLMGFMVWQISINPGSFRHWGTVFFRMCVITTGIGVILAIFIHPRTWCAFCPIGTLQSSVGGHKHKLQIEDGCTNCRVCEKACPKNLKIPSNMKDGEFQSKDCLKCPECQLACPLGLLKLPDQKSEANAPQR